MIELVLQYYDSERRTALVAMGIGIVFLITTWALWQTSSLGTLSRGIAHVFLIAALFQLDAGFVYTRLVSSRATAAGKSYASASEHDITQHEIVRMSRIVKSGFIRGLLAYSALVLGGLALLVLSDSAARHGAGLALLIVGVLGLCVETFSMQSNRGYLSALLARGAS